GNTQSERHNVIINKGHASVPQETLLLKPISDKATASPFEHFLLVSESLHANVGAATYHVAKKSSYVYGKAVSYLIQKWRVVQVKEIEMTVTSPDAFFTIC